MSEEFIEHLKAEIISLKARIASLESELRSEQRRRADYEKALYRHSKPGVRTR